MAIFESTRFAFTKKSQSEFKVFLEGKEPKDIFSNKRGEDEIPLPPIHFPHLGIAMINSKKEEKILEPKMPFPVKSFKEAEHRYECILREEFQWGKQWLRNMQKKMST